MRRIWTAPDPRVEFAYSERLREVLSKPPAMMPEESLVKQPELPEGMRLNPQRIPIPGPPHPDELPPIIDVLEGPIQLIPEAPGEGEEPLPTIPPFVVGDFYISREAVRTIPKGGQIDYQIPNEEDLTFTNNHHWLTIFFQSTSNDRFKWETLMNGFPICEVWHENTKLFYHVTIPVLDNFTYLLVPGPGRTNTLSFKGVSGDGGAQILRFCFSYHKRVGLVLEE